jgi:hypothetical protein
MLIAVTHWEVRQFDCQVRQVSSLLQPPSDEPRARRKSRPGLNQASRTKTSVASLRRPPAIATHSAAIR